MTNPDRRDEVDEIVAAWRRERPDLPTEPLEVLSRVKRVAQQLDHGRRTAFAAHDLQLWEFDVLAKLMSQPQRPLSQEQLIASLYAWGEDIASNAVEVHVHHLRKKLGADWIKTIRGVGYVLNPGKALS